jgi:micrococcal nuclease
MKYFLNMLSLLVLMGAYLTCNSGTVNPENQPGENSYIVRGVSDGDTFWIYNQSQKKEKIRLIGVDAPESRNTFKKKKGYYGNEAKKYLTKLVKGQRVKLSYDVDKKDRYGRTLAYVYLMDGTFVNAHLVKNGYAMTMTIPPNVKFAELFVELQREARENNRGLWSGDYY